MDVTTVNDLAHAAQALLLIVVSFVLAGVVAGGAVDAIGPKPSAEDGTPVKGFYRQKYAAVGGLLALAIFAIGTVVYAGPIALDVAAVIVAAVSIFFAVCLIVEKLPFHSKRAVVTSDVAEAVRPTPPRTIGLMSNQAAEVPAPVAVPVPLGAPVPLAEPAPSDVVPAETEPETVPVGLADVEPEGPASEAAPSVEAEAVGGTSGKGKSKKGKKKKKK